MSELVNSNVDIAILMPKVEDWQRTQTRYGGLCRELLERGVSVVFAESHDSYIGSGIFDQTKIPLDPQLGSMAGFLIEGSAKASVVRDLTMPIINKPLHIDPNGPILVHHPSINELLTSKSSVYDLMADVQPFSITRVEPTDIVEAVAAIKGEKVVIKPDTGSGGEGVYVDYKKEALETYRQNPHAGLSIVQEAIDMSEGLAEHDIPGVHNVRFIVIGGTAIYGFVRSDPTGSATMQGETFENRNFLLPEDFRTSLQILLEAAQEKIVGLKHAEKNSARVRLYSWS